MNLITKHALSMANPAFTERERERESNGAGGRGRDRGSRISPGLEPGVDCTAFNNGDD